MQPPIGRQTIDYLSLHINHLFSLHVKIPPICCQIGPEGKLGSRLAPDHVHGKHPTQPFPEHTPHPLLYLPYPYSLSDFPTSVLHWNFTALTHYQYDTTQVTNLRHILEIAIPQRKGLNTSEKHLQLLSNMRSMKADVIFLQETHFRGKAIQNLTITPIVFMPPPWSQNLTESLHSFPKMYPSKLRIPSLTTRVDTSFLKALSEINRSH